MLEFSHSHIHQLEQINRLKSCFIQPESINKSISASKLIELVDGDMKGKVHSTKTVIEVCGKLSKSTTQEDLEKGEKQLATLELINVVEGNRTVQMFAECRDIEKGEYSDNLLNQLLSRVGKKFKNIEEKIG